MPADPKPVTAWAVFSPSGLCVSAIGDRATDAIFLITRGDMHLWDKMQSKGYRVAKVTITEVVDDR